MLFHITHKHFPDKCWAIKTFVETKSCYKGPIWQNALGKLMKDEYQIEKGVVLHSILINGISHTLFLIVEANSYESVTNFLKPLQNAGYAAVEPVSDLVQLVDSNEKTSSFEKTQIKIQ